jgi:hypothetical protein
MLTLQDVVFGDTRLDVRSSGSEILLDAIDESGVVITVRLRRWDSLALIAALQKMNAVLE